MTWRAWFYRKACRPRPAKKIHDSEENSLPKSYLTEKGEKAYAYLRKNHEIVEYWAKYLALVEESLAKAKRRWENLMSRDNLVTVVISSYNHAPYVEQSILSVIRQTYSPVELLVIDDGSTDDSVKRIEALQRSYGFDFRAQKNKGLTRTLNEAIERAQGAFIAPFGSDDIMLEDRLSLQMSYIVTRPEVGICGGNIELMNADGTPYVARHPKPQPSFRRLDFEDIFLERKPGAHASTLLIRKDALLKVGCFNPNIRLEDLYIKLKITRAGYCIDALGAVLARYRKHPTNTYKNIRFMTESVLRIYADYADHPAYEQVRCRFLNSMLVKASRRDRALAKELLSQLPLSAWNRRTLASLLRYPFAPVVI